MERQELVIDPEALEGADDGLQHEGFQPSLLASPVSGQALRAYLILSQRAAHFLELGWSREAVFWSRYFWFRRFATLRAREVGIDAGVEQQSLALLEHPYPECDPDWSKLQLVENEANAI